MERDNQLITSLVTAMFVVCFMTISTNARATNPSVNNLNPPPSLNPYVARGIANPDATQNAPTEMEKCYGIVKAGQNDCDTNLGSCTPSVVDASPTDWIYLPKGICNRLVNGTTGPNGANVGDAAQVVPNPAAVSQGALIDSAPIMKQDTILNGGAGLDSSSKATKPDSTNTNNSGSELNKY